MQIKALLIAVFVLTAALTGGGIAADRFESLPAAVPAVEHATRSSTNGADARLITASLERRNGCERHVANASRRGGTFERSGCCSHHSGVCGCDGATGMQRCCDGSDSPSCRCGE
jgi:hypothetical protein